MANIYSCIFFILLTSISISFSDKPVIPEINLARTSICNVDVSTVNGGRAPNNPYYGILNAFDGDSGKVIKGCKYTSWLGDNIEKNWVKIVFSQNVSVSRITCKKSIPFTAEIYSNGTLIEVKGESLNKNDAKNEHHNRFLRRQRLQPHRSPKTDYGIILKKKLFDVKSVVLNFKSPPGKSVSIPGADEIEIYGIPPPNIQFSIGPPSIILTKKNVGLIAKDSLNNLAQKKMDSASSASSQNPDSLTINFPYYNKVRFGMDESAVKNLLKSVSQVPQYDKAYWAVWDWTQKSLSGNANRWLFEKRILFKMPFSVYFAFYNNKLGTITLFPDTINTTHLTWLEAEKTLIGLYGKPDNRRLKCIVKSCSNQILSKPVDSVMTETENESVEAVSCWHTGTMRIILRGRSGFFHINLEGITLERAFRARYRKD